MMRERTVRDVGKEIGISAATLSRIERGMEMDGAVLAKILGWLMERGNA